MTTNLEKWPATDPFFFAAQQVQDSADELHSAYQAWIRAKTPEEYSHSWSDGHGICGSLSVDVLQFCRRQLSTALSIAVGQVAEFKEAVVSALSTSHDPEAFARRTEFISAVCNQIMSIKHALRASVDVRDAKVLQAVSFLGPAVSGKFALCWSGAGVGSSGTNMQGRTHTHAVCPELADSKTDIASSSPMLGTCVLQRESLDLSSSAHEASCLQQVGPCLSIDAVDLSVEGYSAGAGAQRMATEFDIKTCASKVTSHVPNHLEVDGSDKEVRIGNIKSEFLKIAVIDPHGNACVVSELIRRDCYEDGTSYWEERAPCMQHASSTANSKSLHMKASGLDLFSVVRALKSLILKRWKGKDAHAYIDMPHIHSMLSGFARSIRLWKGPLLCQASSHKVFPLQFFDGATPAILYAGILICMIAWNQLSDSFSKVYGQQVFNHCSLSVSDIHYM